MVTGRTLLVVALLGAALLGPARAVAAPARPVVMLDPGHGGTNRGAPGATKGVYEKKVTLAICKQVTMALKKLRPRWRVMFTRKVDRYLTLDQRVRMANKADASLFISVHLNASPAHSQRGFETYILSREASNQEAARVAAKENQAEPSEGKSSATPPAVVGQILSDLRQTAAHSGSLRLAKLMQKELAQARGEANDRGVRQAPFDVLLGLTMPGVLLEAGFIDHPEEGPQMIDDDVQRAMAQAVARAVVTYLTK